MENYNCAELMTNTFDVTDIRMALHRTLYTDIQCITKLTDIFANVIDSVNITIKEDRTIAIKIKKTSMKRNDNFIHNVLFYYPRFNYAFNQFLSFYRDRIIEVLRTLYGDLNYVVYNSLVSKEENMNLLYNITCIGDNIIIVQL